MDRKWDDIDHDAMAVILLTGPMFSDITQNIDVFMAAAIGSLAAIHPQCEELHDQLADSHAPERMMHAVRAFAETELQREVNQILERN